MPNCKKHGAEKISYIVSLLRTLICLFVQGFPNLSVAFNIKSKLGEIQIAWKFRIPDKKLRLLIQQITANRLGHARGPFINLTVTLMIKLKTN